MQQPTVLPSTTLAFPPYPSSYMTSSSQITISPSASSFSSQPSQQHSNVLAPGSMPNFEANPQINNTVQHPQQHAISSHSESSPSTSSGSTQFSPTTKKKQKRITEKSEHPEEAFQSVFQANPEASSLETGHPIACVQCRSRHKRCDRTLPACLNCVKRGVECTYRSPKMKGRKDQKFQPYSSLMYIPPANNNGRTKTSSINNSASENTATVDQTYEQMLLTFPQDSSFNNTQSNLFIQNSFSAAPHNQQVSNIQQVNNQRSQSFSSLLTDNPLSTQFTSQHNSNLLSTQDPIFRTNSKSQTEDNDENKKQNKLVEANVVNSNQSNPFLQLSRESIEEILNCLGIKDNQNGPLFTMTQQQQELIAQHIASALLQDSSLAHRLNMNAYKKRTVQLYEEVISMGYPILSTSTLEMAFFNEESMRGIYTNDVLSLLYSIHSVTCQALGVHDEADFAYLKARKLLSDCFDNADNLFIAGTYCFFARYCSGIGDKGKAKFYLQYVDLFFKKKSVNYRTRRHLNYSIEEEAKSGENYSIFAGLSLDEMFLLKYRVLASISVDKSGEFFLNDCSNFPGFTFGTYVAKLVSDGCLYAIGKIPNTIMSIMAQKITEENLNLFLMMLEFSANFLRIHETERQISDTTRSIMNCLHNLYYHGCKLQMMKEANITDERLENEAKLFSLSTLVGPFHLVQPLTLGAMFEAASLHLKILAEIEQGKRLITSTEELCICYQLIEVDLRALEIVRTKNKELIDRMCKPLMDLLSMRVKQFSSSPIYASSSLNSLLSKFESQIPPSHQSNLVKQPPSEADQKFGDSIDLLIHELNR
ncbi:hypothetical protein C9374_003048 [Naegleria lovaniensis]|uniref:Zn(2)-C6 fungal-type domain-containing protein n=1 Tax=Naegleria lovaniensis TaxID=51637 RepID=A0AA88KLJ3_NAELO|nr:uncharacterized protein C9374_003048 [Naegleria lovaniensis]KAG2385899.1 hypothetical protein C9374_003048 [Naegleria lovaniensis]